MEDNDSQLQLKKRARRRLVGAVVFASVVAVVLPMIMDHQPRQVVQDVEIRIPGQDEKPFAPKFAVAPVEKAASADDDKPAPEAAPVAPSARIVEVGKDKDTVKPVTEKVAEKPVAKPEKPVDKAAAEKPVAKPAEADARRAAALLAGQGSAEQPPVKSGEYVILIGAFASEENVRNLKTKLAEKSIRTYTEPLDTPGGKRTRVRAGPFPSRDAAEKALEKMKQIGVSGVIAGK
jgi:DedD protein